MAVAQDIDAGRAKRTETRGVPVAASRRDGQSGFGLDGFRRLGGVLLFACTVLWANDAGAIGLGPARLSSGLGEPLRMSVPVTLQPDEEVGCIQVRPHGDDLPSVFNTRSQVVRSGGQTSIEIRGQQAIDEPAVGLVLSVGCASPIARDYVLFLDPPVLAPTTVDTSVPADLPSRAVPPVPRRATTRPAPPPAAAASASPSRSSPSSRPARPPRTRQATPSAAPGAGPSSTAAGAPSVARSPARGGDRLSIMPTEPPVVGRTSRSPQPGVFPPAVSESTPAPAPVVGTPSVAAGAPPASTPAPVAATAAPADASPASIAATAPMSDAEAVAREDALRQQQAALQTQIKTLSDQIAALRLQTTSLAARNQALEETAFSPTMVWLLIALAVLAIIVAGWMSWRYTQLRRSLEGSAWWTANSTQDIGAGASVVGASSELAALDGGTRMGTRPVAQNDARAAAPPAAPAAVISHVERPRPTVRSASYPAAMDTDFTVSDIEAAMATVRTVSPPRDPKAAPPLEDSDFAPLGGPTIPSPFAEPPVPPPAPAEEPPVDHLGTFVDLDIPPMQPLAAATARDIVTPLAASPAATKPVDFKFDIPDSFDPLATDSHKKTVIDRSGSAGPVDFELPGTTGGLDFDLPTATQIVSLTNLLEEAEAKGAAPRHAAAALDELFAPSEAYGIDTILDLDEREGTPLSATEVDRLTTFEPADAVDHSPAALMRSRMARFAALVDRVDEAAMTDPLRAIAQLRQFVLRDEQIPTLLWLRLFELYRRVDKKPVYEALAEHFARRYHRPMASWTQTLADLAPQTPLSAMPSIDRAIEAQWGSDAGIELMATLLCDRGQEDAIVFNAVLQRDLLDAAKIFPQGGQPHAGPAVGDVGDSLG